MLVSLTPFETDLLNKFVHTQTFDELSDLQMAMNEQLNEDKQTLISNGQTNEADFNSFVTHTTGHITEFLVGHEFYHAREGDVYFLTEKGKHLKARGSFQKYLDWEKVRDQELLDEMHTIQSKGYLEREQPTPAELAPPPIDEERKSNLVYYIIILVLLFILYLVGRNYQSKI